MIGIALDLDLDLDLDLLLFRFAFFSFSFSSVRSLFSFLLFLGLRLDFLSSSVSEWYGQYGQPCSRGANWRSVYRPCVYMLHNDYKL